MIPLMKPCLPEVKSFRPYAERMDASHWYSNFGPLEQEYRGRLADLFGAPVVTASSATSALTAVIMALELPRGSLIACPSWTFAATPASIVAAGHVPFFQDVREYDGVITGDAFQHKGAAAVVVVAPFGLALKIKAWDDWSATGIPVIIDAAAGFDAFSTVCKPGKCPVVVSTHATKTFGTGEGGFVTCQDTDFLERVRRATNFGMTPEREVEFMGLNAKMSEYHAAVGLAELDGWAKKRERWMEIQGWYGMQDNYAVANRVKILEVAAAPIVEKLARKGIEARTGVYGCHRHKAYTKYPLYLLPVTEKLMGASLFLPMFVGMTRGQVDEVSKAVEECLG